MERPERVPFRFRTYSDQNRLLKSKFRQLIILYSKKAKFVSVCNYICATNFVDRKHWLLDKKFSAGEDWVDCRAGILSTRKSLGPLWFTLVHSNQRFIVSDLVFIAWIHPHAPVLRPISLIR